MIVPKLKVGACSSYLTCSHDKKCTNLRVKIKKKKSNCIFKNIND